MKNTYRTDGQVIAAATEAKVRTAIRYAGAFHVLNLQQNEATIGHETFVEAAEVFAKLAGEAPASWKAPILTNGTGTSRLWFPADTTIPRVLWRRTGPPCMAPSSFRGPFCFRPSKPGSDLCGHHLRQVRQQAETEAARVRAHFAQIELRAMGIEATVLDDGRLVVDSSIVDIIRGTDERNP